MAHHLKTADLIQLSLAWETWASSASTPGRALTRLRIYLVFLLIRHGALRLGEVLGLEPARDLDLATGLLRIGGATARKIFLPPAAMRQIRRIISLPEATSPGFLRLDPGFARRMFYAVAEPLGIPKALSGPRAIRQARAAELLALHMPPNMIQEFLGLRKPGAMAALLGGAIGHLQDNPGDNNSFLAEITDLDEGMGSARIQMRTFSGLPLISICSMKDYIRLDPRVGQVARANVEPGHVLIALQNPAPCAANHFRGTVHSIYKDSIESQLLIDLPGGDRLAALLDARGQLDPRPGTEVFVFFSGRALQTRPQ